MAHANFDPKLHDLLAEHLSVDSKLAFLAVDSEFTICEVSPNCEIFLGKAPLVGVKLDEAVDCMVGLDFSASVRWPIVENRHGLPMTLSTVHIDDRLYVLMTDASESLAQQKALQQAANDNELLLNEKEALVLDLERKQLALEQASRLQTAFLAGVAHEFRTPLVSILGYAELVEKVFIGDDTQRTNSAEHRQWVAGIQRSGRHLLSLIENLLDHGKSQNEQLQLNFTPVNIKTLLRDIELLMTPQAKQKGVEFKMRLNGSTVMTDSWVMADSARLTQCLINLVGNAIKFTDEGSVTINANYDEQVLSIEITDTGIGMSDQELMMVREPFWQSHHQQRPGTGLGVTITDGLIDLMGGELLINSKSNVGTSVELSLPLEPASKSLQKSAEAQNLDGICCRLLMVEDDDDIALMLEAMLSERGFSVTRAADGASALRVIESAAFDLILMDVVLPIEDGFDVAAKLREAGCTSPIVMMSASQQEFATRNVDDAQYDGYLLKPIAVNDVVAIAKEFAVLKNSLHG